MSDHELVERLEELCERSDGSPRRCWLIWARWRVLLARRAPRPDVPERIERVAEQAVLVAPGPVRQEDKARVAPRAPERFALQVTIGEATQRKLLRAQALLDRVEGRKLGKTRTPHAAKKSSVRRYVPRAVRRQAGLRWMGVTPSDAR